MVSNRCIVGCRQILVVTLSLFSVGIFLSIKQGELQDAVSGAVSQLAKLHEIQDNLQKSQEKFRIKSNQTFEFVRAHEKHIESLNQFTRKKNLLFKGVKEGDQENTESKILELMKEKLGISLQSEDIEYANRMTKGLNKKSRPILIRFNRWKDRSRVFYKRKSLPREISMEEDLTTKQRENRMKVDALAKEAMKEGKQIKWNRGKLFINGVEQKVDEMLS